LYINHITNVDNQGEIKLKKMLNTS